MILTDFGVVRIEIRDNGVGIPAAALTTIFERFTRAHADDGATVHVGGIGLLYDETARTARLTRGRTKSRRSHRLRFQAGHTV
jgi:signal transduction histidine kinase